MKLFIFLVLLTSIVFPSYGQREEWPAMADKSLTVEPESVLDFSWLRTVQSIGEKERLVLNEDGAFATAAKPNESIRFLIASLGYTTATGGIPPKIAIDRDVAELVRRGYNMVRLDFLEDSLMEGQKEDFDFNKIQLDRFYYLISVLKRSGIYATINVQTRGNGAYGNIGNRWKDSMALLIRNYVDPEAQAHWRKFIDELYLRKNPYTKIPTLHDPALAGLYLANESGVAFLSRNGISPILKPAFKDFLIRRYKGQENVNKALRSGGSASTEMKGDEISFPKPNAMPSPLVADVQRFFFEMEARTAEWMTEYLRKNGYKGFVTSYNNWLSPAAQASRAQFSWVDMHNYNGEPSLWIEPGSVMSQESVLEQSGRYVYELSASRHWGKAFTVSEYGQVFWNKYRRESSILVPAYAAFQNWNAICQHNNSFSLDYASNRSGLAGAIHPFAVTLDPINRATEVMSALLYRRGDVAQAKSKVTINLTPDFAFNKSAQLWAMPADIAKIGMVTGLGLQWNPDGKKIVAAYQVEPEVPRLAWAGRKVDAGVRRLGGAIKWSERIDDLREAGIIGAKNRSSATTSTFESDTGEIILDSPKKLLLVKTPKTEAVAFFDASDAQNIGVLQVLKSSAPAMVAVSAIDNQLLKNTKRALVVVSTDARNSGMTFKDSAETTLEKLGKFPVRLSPVRVSMKLNTGKRPMAVYAVAQNGKRVGSIPVSQLEDGIQFDFNTVVESYGPVMYAEVVEK